MAWLTAHWTQILTVWGVIWALATCLQGAFPVNSLAWKVCHTVLAVSPLDFVKATKTLGAALVPPLAVLCLAVLSGCSTALVAPNANAQAVAQKAVATASDAWNLAAQACLAAAGDNDGSASNPALAHECELALQPVHDNIVAAGVAANVWDDAAQARYACLMGDVSHGLALAAGLLHLPPAVNDAAIVARSFAGDGCAP